MHKDTHPVFVGAADAAAAIGVSKNGFLNGVTKGTLPPPKRLGKRKLWELSKLIEAVRALNSSNTDSSEREPALEGQAGKADPRQVQSAAERREG